MPQNYYYQPEEGRMRKEVRGAQQHFYGFDAESCEFSHRYCISCERLQSKHFVVVGFFGSLLFIGNWAIEQAGLSCNLYASHGTFAVVSWISLNQTFYSALRVMSVYLQCDARGFERHVEPTCWCWGWMLLGPISTPSFWQCPTEQPVTLALKFK